MSINSKNESRIILGTMRIPSKSNKEIKDLLYTAKACGINFIDTADIYTNGVSEEKLGEILSEEPELRDHFLVQTKCGILRSELCDCKDNYLDLSYNYIKEAVDASLARLKTNKVHSLLLHRPDVFLDAKEIVKAYDELIKENKIDHFGVSNQDDSLMDYINSEAKSELGKDIIEYNQLQMSIAECQLVENVVNFNMCSPASINRVNGTYFYCKKNKIKIQCWSPLQKGFFSGVFIDDYENYKDLNEYLDSLAVKYQTNKTALALAWLLNLSDDMQVVIGTTNPNRVKDSCEAFNIKLSKDEWYMIYKKAGHVLP